MFSSSIKYLDLEREGPNRGTTNKKILTKETLQHISEWKSGQYDVWITMLGTRLGLAVRTVKDNYVNPLIKEGIIRKNGSTVYFVGPPEDSESTQE